MLFPHQPREGAARIGKASTPAMVVGTSSSSSSNNNNNTIPNPNRPPKLPIPTLFPTRHHHSPTTTTLPLPTTLAGEKRPSEEPPPPQQLQRAIGNKRHCTDVTKQIQQQQQQQQQQHPPVLGFDTHGEVDATAVNLKKRSSRDVLVDDAATHGRPLPSPSKKSKTHNDSDRNRNDCCFERNGETVPMAISEDDDDDENDDVPMELSKAEDPPDAANEVWNFIGVG